MRIPYSVRGRSVTASPLLFALVAFGMMVWLVHVWAITLDYLSTGAAPSFVLHMTFTALTVWISLALMLKREVAIGPNQQITVDDRLFGLLIKRRRLQVQPDVTAPRRKRRGFPLLRPLLPNWQIDAGLHG